MKKMFFSMAGIALVAGSALAFSTAKSNQPMPCDDPNVDEHCIDPTLPTDPEACCFRIIDGTPQYYRLLEE